MQLLILLDRFEREEGKDTLPLGVLVDDDVFHPTVRCAAVVLQRKLVCVREIFGRHKPRTE